MAQYEKKILNALLDSYEKSLLFTGKNKVNIRISFPFTIKTVPEYFNESSLVYEELHIKLAELERQGLITVIWKRKNHIIQKVLLEESRAADVYRLLKRTPKKDSVNGTLGVLDEIDHASTVCRAFIEWLRARIQEGESVKEYIDLENQNKTRQLLTAIARIEANTEECYIRECSIRWFGDSKTLEGYLGTIGKVMRRFGCQFDDMDVYAILAEYSVYHTPNYVYIKGDGGILQFGDSRILLRELKQGIGISGEDLPSVKLAGMERIRKVITIENLTTFFCWQEPDSILIYLGGYHNSVRRALLGLIGSQLPDAEFLHFGDIDAGGFEIYEDLCRKTGILFRPYHMSVEILERYADYTKELTVNDHRRLAEMQKRKPDCCYADVLAYMLARNVKLEQECIIPDEIW